MCSTTKACRRARLAPAAVAAVAIVGVVAGTGSAVAAKLITGSDIKDNTVTTSDIKNGTLQGKDLKAQSLPEAKLVDSVKKKLNAPALHGYEMKTATYSVPSNGAKTVNAFCTPGKVAVGGGGSFSTTEFDATIQESRPRTLLYAKKQLPIDGPPNSWGVTGSHHGLDPVDLTAYVICVAPN